jgi:PAS domain S-box-containing protein
LARHTTNRLEQCEAVLANVVEAIITFDAEGNITFANPSALRYHGFASQQDMLLPVSVMKDIFEMRDPDGRVIPFEEWPVAQCLAGQSVHERELTVINKATNVSWSGIYNACPIFDSSGTLQQIIQSTRDAGKRRTAREKLRKSEEQLRLALESSKMGMWDWNITTGEIWATPRCRELFATKPETPANYETFLNALLPEDRDEIDHAVREALEQRKDYEAEMRVPWPDGTIHWIVSRGRGYYDDGGTAVRMTGTAVDVTAKKRVEEELRESELRYKTLAAGTFEGICLSQSGRITDLNPQFAKMLGYEPDEMIGMELEPMIAAEDRARVMGNIKAAREVFSENGMVRKDGSVVTVEAHGKTISFRSRVVRFSVLHDISARKRYEDQLRASEERLRLAGEAAEVGFWDYNVRDDKLVWSQSCKKIFGYAPEEEITYDKWLDRIHPDDKALSQETWRHAVEQQKDYVMEHRVVMPGGYIHWVQCKGRPYFDDQGRPVRIAGISIDITARKQHEERLERLTDELDGRRKELESIISFISHDLRSPLVNIKGFAGELARDCDRLKILLTEVYIPQVLHDETAHIFQAIPESLNFIQTSADVMNGIINSLVQIARAGVAAVNPEELNMNELISTVLHTHEMKIKEASAKIIVDELPGCIGDKIQIMQVFANLIDNALKYRDPQRQLEIHISGTINHNGRDSVYVVEDNGIGIEPKFQERIFDLFYRPEGQRTGGEGIGLSMVKRMLDRNHGQVCLDSEPGKGSRFFVLLPRIK